MSGPLKVTRRGVLMAVAFVALGASLVAVVVVVVGVAWLLFSKIGFWALAAVVLIIAGAVRLANWPEGRALSTPATRWNGDRGPRKSKEGTAA